MSASHPAPSRAQTFEELSSLFFSDVFFKCKALCGDDEIAKGVAKKVFQLAKAEFSAAKNNHLDFLDGILNRLVEHSKTD